MCCCCQFGAFACCHFVFVVDIKIHLVVARLVYIVAVRLLWVVVFRFVCLLVVVFVPFFVSFVCWCRRSLDVFVSCACCAVCVLSFRCVSSLSFPRVCLFFFSCVLSCWCCGGDVLGVCVFIVPSVCLFVLVWAGFVVVL